MRKSGIVAVCLTVGVVGAGVAPVSQAEARGRLAPISMAEASARATFFGEFDLAYGTASSYSVPWCKRRSSERIVCLLREVPLNVYDSRTGLPITEPVRMRLALVKEWDTSGVWQFNSLTHGGYYDSVLSCGDRNCHTRERPHPVIIEPPDGREPSPNDRGRVGPT